MLLIPVVFCSACNGQTKTKIDNLLSSKENKIEATTDDTLNKPKVNIKVNKQFDDKGNIVQYDSTYSYYYSSPGGNIMHLSNDSVYHRFRSFFNKTYPGFFIPPYDDIFFNDSLYKHDFFNKDYFEKRFELNRKMFERMYQQMDSLKENYLEQTYPKGEQKKN